MLKKDRKKLKQLNILFPSPFDPLGSWTGRYILGEYEEPDQDVDDL